MKSLILAGAVAVACVSGEALADCTSGRILSGTELKTLMTGNTLCVPVATVATMTYQELHAANGDLVDYKRGPGHTIDPTQKVGTWTVTAPPGSGGAMLNHIYPSVTQSYAVYKNADGHHSFCRAGAPEMVGRVKPGGGAC